MDARLTPGDMPARAGDVRASAEDERAVPRHPPEIAGAQDLPAELERRIGQLLLVGFRGLAAREAAPVLRHVAAGLVGGLVLYDVDLHTQAPRNIASPAQLQSLVAALKATGAIPPFVAVDAEGGLYTRLRQRQGFPPTRPAQELGALNDTAVTRAAAGAIADVLVEMGIDVNLAPVLDLLSPANASSDTRRNYSSSPTAVVEHAREFIAAHHQRGLLTVAKHFPGMGSSTRLTADRPGEVTADWSRTELEPYRVLIGEGALDAAMVTRVAVLAADPDLPATLSPRVVGGLLRDELRFGGVVVSDCLDTPPLGEALGLERAAILAVRAGVDVLFLANYSWAMPYDDDVAPRIVAALAAAVRAGEIAEARIDEAWGRVLAFKRRIGRPGPA